MKNDLSRRNAVRRFTALFAVMAAGLAAAQDNPWRQATPGRAINLPADHSSHPEYQIEWWYYSGNLDARDGRRFGYQLTFFRVGVDPHPSSSSRWAVRDLFLAHLAVTNVAAKTHRSAERMNRAGPGLAGAETAGYHVWNDDWSVSLGPEGAHVLKARTPEIGVDLTLQPVRAAVLHGDRGYSRKGTDAGNASHYYSLTRMATTGRIVADGQSIEVSGSSWMDHEFGTSFLEREQLGWDWVALQLDDGRDVMIYQLRRSDGSVDPRSSGTILEQDGRTVSVGFLPASTNARTAKPFTLRPGRIWISPATGGRYPVQWHLDIPDAALNLDVTATVDGQELVTTRSAAVKYWEGAVDVTGHSQGKPTKGRGYLEMTGYAGRPVGNLFSTFR